MTVDDIKKLVREIIKQSQQLSKKHTSGQKMPVNYACIFTHTAEEYEKFIEATKQIGKILQETETGPIFYITPLSTAAGILKLLKIRRPDSKRPERGDADFTVADYQIFKKSYLGKPGFNLIKRPKMEMIELIDPSYNVLAYYSHPTLEETLNTK